MCFGSKAGDLISQSFLSLQAFAPVENYKVVHSQALASRAAQCSTCHSFIAWFKLSQAKNRERKREKVIGHLVHFSSRASIVSKEIHLVVMFIFVTSHLHLQIPKEWCVGMAWHVYAAHAKYLSKATLATHSWYNCGGNKGKVQARKYKPEHLSPCCNSNRWNTSVMRFGRPEPPADVVAALTGSILGGILMTLGAEAGEGRGGRSVAEVKGHGMLLEVCAKHPVVDESGASLLLRVTVVGQPVPNLLPLSLTSWRKCLGCLCWHTCERGCWVSSIFQVQFASLCRR